MKTGSCRVCRISRSHALNKTYSTVQDGQEALGSGQLFNINENGMITEFIFCLSKVLLSLGTFSWTISSLSALAKLFMLIMLFQMGVSYLVSCRKLILILARKYFRNPSSEIIRNYNSDNKFS